MFDRLVPRYDLVNTLMSLGQHRRWRRQATRLASPRAAQALDVATGTGDLAVELARAGAKTVVGVDFSPRMLEAARRKVAAANLGARVQLVEADALALPFGDGTFDCVASAFLLRNLTDLRAGLREMRRVLRPGGRVVALEITRAPAGWVGRAAAGYFRRVLPLIGGLVSGHWAAYRYLPASLDPFPSSDALQRLFAEAGFEAVQHRRTGLGLVAIHMGQVTPSRDTDRSPTG